MFSQPVRSRAAYRTHADPGFRCNQSGFRVVLVVSTAAGVRTERGAKDKPSSPAIAPFTGADVQRIAALPAVQQVEEVRKELVRRNPGFDGKVEHKIEDGVVTEIKVVTDKVKDVAPIRVWSALRVLHLYATNVGDAGLADLKDCKELTELWLGGLTKVSDAGLAHFKDCKNLTDLHVEATQVGDAGLAQFKGMRLMELNIANTAITDLTPLQGMPLEHVRLTPKNITRGLDILRDMKSLKTIGITWNQAWPAAEFWERFGKGEFKE